MEREGREEKRGTEEEVGMRGENIYSNLDSLHPYYIYVCLVTDQVRIQGLERPQTPWEREH